MKRTAKAAAVLVALAACGQAEDNRSGDDIGDIRGVEELGNQNLTALASGDAVFNATTGALTVTLGAAETLVSVSKRASDSAVLLNGFPVVDTTKTVIATATSVKRLNLNVGADATTVVFDYYNGTFNPGTKPVTPAVFGTAGSVVAFGAHVQGSVKVRATSNADTIYVGQDSLTAMSPNVLISFSGTSPDIEVTATTMPSLGFNLGAGNDTFDAVNAKGATLHSLTFPVSVHGGLGNDSLVGGTGADSLYGDEGLNVIDEGSGSTVAAHTADFLYGLTTPATGTNTTTVTYATWAGAAGVTAKLAHLSTALIVGVTDNIDDTVTTVVGSPLADTMACSQLTDMPCFLQGGAGDDTLSPGLSVTNTHYLYGGDGNDTFVMTLPASKVSLVGGNVSDITSTKNLFVDTVDYSAAISALTPVATSISMNGTPPTSCNLATSTTIPPCPGTADATSSGFFGAAHTDIRNDITVAKCPTGAPSAGVVCTVKGNNLGDTIYSGWGSDVLTGGTGDDIFVLADFNAAGTYTGAVTKTVTGGNGNDTADFSQHTSAVAIRLDCALATCANSGNPVVGITAGSTAASTAATMAAATSASDATTLATAFAAVNAPTAADTAVDSAAVAANAAAQAAATAVALAVAHPTSAADSAAAIAAAATATTAAAASVAANVANTTGNAGVLSDAQAVAAAATTVAAQASLFGSITEGISLVNINNAVCPAGGTSSCAVTSNGNADVIDFNGDGAVAGSALICNGSDITIVRAQGLAQDCGI